MKIKESDLFPAVKEWLEERGYEVYSEVKCKGNSGRADVVGKSGNLITVVEMKISVSLALIEQAFRWKRLANYVYVAIPKPQKGVHWFAARMLRREGIGILFIDCKSREPWAYANCEPKLNRKIESYLREALREEHKNGPPGGHAGGGYVTEYKLTIKRVKEFLQWRTRNGEWLTITEVLEDCWTHYHTPKQSLSNALLKIESDWCEAKKINGRWHFRFKNCKGGY